MIPLWLQVIFYVGLVIAGVGCLWGTFNLIDKRNVYGHWFTRLPSWYRVCYILVVLIIGGALLMYGLGGLIHINSHY